MTIGELLADLRTRDIRIWLEGEKLRCSAPPGALDAETKSLVAERRQEIIDALRQAGVTFDTFEMEGIEWNDDVATFDEMRSVWFRDPDGNILNVESRA